MLGGWLVNLLGRRTALRVMTAPQTLGWLVVLAAGPGSGAAPLDALTDGAGVTGAHFHGRRRHLQE